MPNIIILKLILGDQPLLGTANRFVKWGDLIGCLYVLILCDRVYCYGEHVRVYSQSD